MLNGWDLDELLLLRDASPSSSATSVHKPAGKLLCRKVTKQDDDSAQEGEYGEEEVQTEPDVEVELPGEDDDEDDGFGPGGEDDLDEEVAPAEDGADDAETQADVGKE